MPAVVELLALDDDLEAVVVLVELALGPSTPGMTCWAGNSIAVPTWNMRLVYPSATWISPSAPASIAA